MLEKDIISSDPKINSLPKLPQGADDKANLDETRKCEKGRTLCTSHMDAKCYCLSVLKSMGNISFKPTILDESTMHRPNVLEVDGLK